MYMFIVTGIIALGGYSVQAAEHRCGPPVEHRIMMEPDRYERIRARIDAVQQEMIDDVQRYGQQEICNCCGCSITHDQMGCASTLVATCSATLTAIYCNLPVIYTPAVALVVATTVGDCFKLNQDAKKAKLNRLRDKLYR